MQPGGGGPFAAVNLLCSLQFSHPTADMATTNMRKPSCWQIVGTDLAVYRFGGHLNYPVKLNWSILQPPKIPNVPYMCPIEKCTNQTYPNSIPIIMFNPHF